MELVGPRPRVTGGAIISCFYSAGMVLLSAVALWPKKLEDFANHICTRFNMLPILLVSTYSSALRVDQGDL